MPNDCSTMVTGPLSGLNITYQVRPLTVAPSTTGRKMSERTVILPLSFEFNSQAISTASPFWTTVTTSENTTVAWSARIKNCWPPVSSS